MHVKCDFSVWQLLVIWSFIIIIFEASLLSSRLREMPVDACSYYFLAVLIVKFLVCVLVFLCFGVVTYTVLICVDMFLSGSFQEGLEEIQKCSMIQC